MLDHILWNFVAKPIHPNGIAAMSGFTGRGEVNLSMFIKNRELESSKKRKLVLLVSCSPQYSCLRTVMGQERMVQLVLQLIYFIDYFHNRCVSYIIFIARHLLLFIFQFEYTLDQPPTLKCTRASQPLSTVCVWVCVRERKRRCVRSWYEIYEAKVGFIVQYGWAITVPFKMKEMSNS